jgi:hypothetical protein
MVTICTLTLLSIGGESLFIQITKYEREQKDLLTFVADCRTVVGRERHGGPVSVLPLKVVTVLGVVLGGMPPLGQEGAEGELAWGVPRAPVPVPSRAERALRMVARTRAPMFRTFRTRVVLESFQVASSRTNVMIMRGLLREAEALLGTTLLRVSSRYGKRAHLSFSERSSIANPIQTTHTPRL